MIIYDLTVTQPQGSDIKFHGAGKYAEIIFYRMIDRGIYFCAYYNSNNFIKPELLNIAKLHSIPLYDISTTTLGDISGKTKSPLIFSLNPHAGQLVCRTIGTIHDVRELYTPNDSFQLKYNLNFRDIKIFFIRKFFPRIYNNRRIKQLMTLWANDNFIPTTITNYSKYTIYNLYSADKILKMPVFYTPTDMGVCTSKISDGKIILMVSGNRWIKNCLRGIIALDNLFSRGFLPAYKVVVTGVPAPYIYKYKIHNKGQFIFKGYVDESELNDLYSSCSCLLFPSLYEGFGMPPIEAMRYGKPVISSCLSSMPEVCESAALYFDPYSIDDISTKILSLLCDKKNYDEMTIRSQKRYNEMSHKQKEDIDGFIDYVLTYE